MCNIHLPTTTPGPKPAPKEPETPNRPSFLDLPGEIRNSIYLAILRDTKELIFSPLPSSSPAYTLPFAAKAERWAELKPLLG